MTRRFLPPHEWSKLAETGLSTVWPLLPIDRSCVLVVEDEGAIVGCWAFLWVLHAEGVWIAPAFRKGSSVARHLMRGLREVSDLLGTPTIWTGSMDPQIDALLTRHLGAQELPMKSFVIPMVKGES